MYHHVLFSFLVISKMRSEECRLDWTIQWDIPELNFKWYDIYIHYVPAERSKQLHYLHVCAHCMVANPPFRTARLPYFHFLFTYFGQPRVILLKSPWF